MSAMAWWNDMRARSEEITLWCWCECPRCTGTTLSKGETREVLSEARTILWYLPLAEVERHGGWDLGPSIVRKLNEAGYATVGDVVTASREDVLAIRGVGPFTYDRVLLRAFERAYRGVVYSRFTAGCDEWIAEEGHRYLEEIRQAEAGA